MIYGKATIDLLLLVSDVTVGDVMPAPAPLTAATLSS